ncbi:MAG: RNA-directed DNA polymerase [Acidobacteriales bacterium]|nr:RNA-directed DNA polymerase [Terriglobales bacterium]
MTGIHPGLLARRAVGQYRRRDPLAYLALRYYLESEATRCDEWAEDVATDLVRGRTEGSYFRAFHYKETEASGRALHREIFVPSANEALAEAALLKECAKSTVFSNPANVFSYELGRDRNSVGVFEHYLEGIRERHLRIAQACDDCPDGIVQYTDLKRFYPSIATDAAEEAWRTTCEAAQLSSWARDLGRKLIADHARERRGSGKGILTGPMFSHLIGNLVLRKLDIESPHILSAKYFRYVDDITLVGGRQEVKYSVAILRERLGDMGFDLHDDDSPKTHHVPAKEWLMGRNDFCDEKRPISWPRLVGELKAFLLANPDKAAALKAAFRDHSFRLPVPDYSALARERNCTARLLRWAGKWVHHISIRSLLDQATQLRDSTQTEFVRLAENAETLEGYERKRRVTKLRYRASRLMYLALDSDLAKLALAVRNMTELRLHAIGMAAIAQRVVGDLLPLGVNAVQAAAQAIAATDSPCQLGRELRQGEEQEVDEQGIAYLLLNGVSVSSQSPADKSACELLRFASVGADMALMHSADPFLREISCLHGLYGEPRHAAVLRTPFDENEELILDAVEQDYQESS